MLQLGSQIRLNLMIARFSGVLAGLAVVLVADCWLLHPPFILSVIGTCATLFGAVLLNTVEWDVVVSDVQHVHRQVVVLLALAYGAIFFQASHVVWNLVQAGTDSHPSAWNDAEVCHTRCCISMEGYYVLFMFVSCSLLRFAEPLLRELGGEAYTLVESTPVSHGNSIGMTLCAAGAFVSAMLLQMFASFGNFGSSTALLVPVPYLCMMPLMFVIRIKTTLTPSAVWHNFNCFSPALAYVFCSSWPLILFHREYLNKVQCILGICTTLLILTAARSTVYVIEKHTANAQAVPNQGFVF